MRSQSLLFVLISTASAFSPAALPSSRRRDAGGVVLGGGGAARSCAPPPSRPPAHRRAGASCSPNGVGHRRSPRFGADSNNGINGSFRTATILAASASSPPAPLFSSAAPSRKSTQKKRIAVLMAFMTGWADLNFLSKYGFFGTMMTGNAMKMADAAVGGRARDALFFLSVIASYIVGVGTFRRAELSYKDKALAGLFAPVVAGCFLWSDYLYWTNPAGRFVPAGLLSFAWGIINSVGSEVTGTLVFVLTGAMTRLSNMVVDRFSRTAGRKKIPKEGFLMSLSVIGGFTLGAAWSAILAKQAPKLMSRGSFSIMGGIYGLLFLWLDRTELGAWFSRNQLCEIDAEEIDCN